MGAGRPGIACGGPCRCPLIRADAISGTTGATPAAPSHRLVHGAQHDDPNKGGRSEREDSEPSTVEGSHVLDTESFHAHGFRSVSR